MTMDNNFKLRTLSCFVTKNGINHNFSAPRTPQQNGVVVRKNKKDDGTHKPRGGELVLKTKRTFKTKVTKTSFVRIVS